MTEYKYYLQRNCIATFEPKIFFSRGSNRNEFDPDADIQWTTITQGAVDSLMAIDVIANNKQIDSSKIGIMWWSYGGSVAVETQNMFNLDVIKPKNQLSIKNLPNNSVPIPDFVVVNKNLVKPREIDKNELIFYINKLKSNSKYRKKLGEQLNKKVKLDFTIEKYFNEIHKVYSSI